MRQANALGYELRNVKCFQALQRHSNTANKGLRRLVKVCSNANEGDLLDNIEQQVQSDKEKSSAGKGFGKPQPKSKKKKPQLEMQQAKAKAEIDKPFASQLNRELSTADKVEETIVRTLAFLFVVFFSEGLFLAVAGFLPEAADDFAVKYVYPAFSPTLGVFLAISVVYGLLKTRQQSEGS